VPYLPPALRQNDRPFRSRRTCLAIPGSSPKMMAKGTTLPADQVFLDLEDAVAPKSKPGARDDIVSALRDLDWSGKTRVVRVNDCTTPWTLRDLETIIIGAGEHIDAIMLPKVQFAGQVHFVDHAITQLEMERGLPVGAIGLELQIENAQGLVNAREILDASYRTEAFIFGPGDMAAALGMPSLSVGAIQPDYPGDHWHGVLFTVLVHARNAGVQAIDGPYARIKDVDGFREVALRSRTLGFDGKWVLHPDQISAGNEVFSVPIESFERAVDIMDAYAAATSSDEDARGAVMFGDEMIDEASRKMAEATLVRGRAQQLQARPVADSVPFHERAAARAAAEGAA
jgi:citrate lyase subunit beta/citryl-CoA lyase